MVDFTSRLLFWGGSINNTSEAGFGARNGNNERTNTNNNIGGRRALSRGEADTSRGDGRFGEKGTIILARPKDQTKGKGS